MRTLWLASFLVFTFAPFSVRAADILMGIAEGVAEQSSFVEMQEKYQPLADYLGRVLKTRVKLESSQNIKSAVLNLKNKRYELMFCRPSNVAAQAIRDNGYQLVSMAKGDFTANFIVLKNSPLTKKEDVLTHVIALPESNSLMAQVGLATLRDLGGSPDPKQLRFTRYQEAVNFMIEKKFADVGIVAPAQAKLWISSGGTVLFKSKPLPFWSIIASSKISKNDVAKMQAALIDMANNEEGKKILAKVNVKSWVTGNPKEYLDLLTWLGL